MSNTENTLTEQIEVLTLEQQGWDDPLAPQDPSKTGPKPANKKKLVAVEVYGYQVGRGLNRRVISPDEVYKLAAIGSSDREIAQWFSMKEDTLRYNFAEILQTAREDMKQSLRMAQLKLALSGNATMLIWLGKQILGQQEQPTNNDEKAPLPWKEDEE